MKTVWIIGASSGLARDTALTFAANDWQVIVGARSFADPEKQLPGKNIISIPLDVTDDDSCVSFAEKALAVSPRIDVFIYGAAILVLGSCEETSHDEYLRVMETNFLGLEKMTRLVLPVMRGQREGKLLFFSSINGLMGIPFQSAYTASKHAIEGYAECLAMELAPFGLQVSLVEPGDHRGGSQRTRIHARGENEQSPYKQNCDAACTVIARDEAGGSLPDVLGKKLYRRLTKRRTPFRIRIAKPDQHLAVWLHTLLPFSMNACILRGYYHVRKDVQS